MDTSDVLQLIVTVAEDVVTPRFRRLGEGQVREKNPGDLVTVADTEAEAALTAALSAAHPDALVVGEEAVAADPSLLDGLGRAEHAWVIDPIDGTANFVRGSEDHAVMVAELRSGRAVRAWIHQPQHRTSWVAELGAGVWRDGHRVHREPVGDDPGSWRGVSSRARWRDASFPPLGPIGTSAWCCGVDYPRLLTGETDFVVYSAPRPWDHVPGTLMLRELGGEARLTTGEHYRATSGGAPLVVGASPRVTDTVVDALAG
ncbi:inositol monophosphatase [Auraticoccus sp. F435]|uniref:Inositol monophosphatase n=1 Tax=Auraticoccus cholistanensis TaxID=2656650 RepID=A0A6A9V1U6_9ACTN|nr:inositol monophosphatase family protein [Auraticoccus cholistanensis]MVA77544.1 inositol monophosphatase [Auraticoccus cholistanensis]